MKRVSIAAAVCLAVVVGLMLNAQPVSAQAAIVIHDNGECGLAGSDANGDIIAGGTGNMFLYVENGNKVTIKCIGAAINDSGQGQHYSGFDCGILTADQQFIITDDSHATVSASGVSTLTCTFKK
jgi:hypothetical protein